jgi:hypothetical protein
LGGGERTQGRRGRERAGGGGGEEGDLAERPAPRRAAPLHTHARAASSSNDQKTTSTPTTTPATTMPFPRLEQEDRLEALFADLDARLKRLSKLKPGDGKAAPALKEVTGLLKEGKA